MRNTVAVANPNVAPKPCLSNGRHCDPERAGRKNSIHKAKYIMKKLKITVSGKTYEVDVEFLGEGEPSQPASKNQTDAQRIPDTGERAESGSARAGERAENTAASSAEAITSPLSAVVVSIDVAVGDAVKEGQKVVTLEAMKMNTIVSAPGAGTVKAIHVGPGDAVEEGQVLAELS